MRRIRPRMGAGGHGQLCFGRLYGRQQRLDGIFREGFSSSEHLRLCWREKNDAGQGELGESFEGYPGNRKKRAGIP